MTLPDWVPEGIEVTVPNAARMYDYALGGYHNFAIDREFVERAEKLAPGAIAHGHANRAFVRRVVRWLIDAGIRQFLDIGSGIPTLGNVHEIALAAAPESRIVYVDIDPVAVAHSRAILADNPHVTVIQADLRKPPDILYDPDVVQQLDFSQPVAVLLNAVLHFIDDSDDLAGIVAQIREPLVRGSFLSMTHGTMRRVNPEGQKEVQRLYQQTPTSVHYRNAEQIKKWLTGFEVIEPGIVLVNEWHPDPEEADDPPQDGILALVARKA